jgi:lipopolysaccharide transport system permease protein
MLKFLNSVNAPTQELASTKVPVFKIRPSRGLPRLNLGELWEYRELLYILIWRDVKVRYKQTVLGVAWTVLQPFLAMVVFTIFLGKLAKVPSDGIPYPVFAYTGLVLWQFFAKALTEASTSLVVNERVITKVYFPRLLVPTSVVLAGLLDFGIALVLLVGLMALYGISVSSNLLLAPCFLLLALVASLGVSFWLSALDVKYRDVRYTLTFLTQIWMFATPVVYPGSLVPERFRIWYALNPMVGVIEGFRWSLLGKSSPPDMAMLLTSVVVIALILVCGISYFRSMERTLADVI